MCIAVCRHWFNVFNFGVRNVKVLSSAFEKRCPFEKVAFSAQHLNLLLPRDIKVNSYCVAAKMEDNDLLGPPNNLNGMKVLDKNAFQKTITVSCLEVDTLNLKLVHSLLKNYYLKVMKIKPLQETGNKKRILLNPALIKTWNDFDENIRNQLEKVKIFEDSFSEVPLTLSYENWTASVLLKAIFPKGETPQTSFSVVGHIIQLNLRDHLMDYKHIMAQILMDKVAGIKTIVNKTNIIDNVYRTFEMEVLIGEPNFIATVKENCCVFELDFSKVYWNPRLSTERARIVESMKERDVLFDVFAGVGPFSILAAKKKVTTFANDLNPESFKWLNHNIKLNKRAINYITTFNKDGSDFILTDVKCNLIKIWQDEDFEGQIYFVMNLPALAPTFLKYFKGLITKNDLLNLDISRVEKCLPIIHCHFFAMNKENTREVFENSSGMDLSNFKHEFVIVRNVSDSKNMHRATFQMQVDYLLAEKPNNESESGESLPKRPRSSLVV